MISSADIRAAWLKLLFSTEPADRPRAEAAARDLYAAAGLAAPRYFLWFDSPFDAAWAAALLQEPTKDHWHQVLRQAARKPAQRATSERLRHRLWQDLAEPDWPGVLSAVGPPVETFEIFKTRLQLYPSADVLRRSMALGGDRDDLYRAGGHYWENVRGVLGHQEICGPVGLLVNHSQFDLYTFSTMAVDEAQAEAQAAGRTPPPPLAAYWEIARSAGPWWAFEHAVIFTDRPAEIHVDDRYLLHRTDGPAATYRDGAQVWAVDGHAVRPPAPESKESPMPKKDTARYLDRYLAGEHQQVWADLIALGPAVREAPYASAAEAVARETMQRVAENVRTVIARLRAMNYTFKTMDMYFPEIKGPDLLPHIPPGPETPQLLQELDELAGPVPLSLRAFFEIVGYVNLVGYHPTLSPEDQSGGYFLPDPLVILPLDAMLQEFQQMDDTSSIDLAPDAYHKADFSGGAPYAMALPDPRADGEFLNERHRLFFVDYLRLAFRHGGFPGYEGLDRDVPPEIATLSQDLLPF